MPVIESYSFGHLVVDGTSYSKDVLLFPDNSILYPWWRISGHKLEVLDIEKLINMNPEIIIAGTGANGLMSPSGELQEFLQERSIEFVSLPTGKAVDVYNEMISTKRTGGCFHLTC
jgi:hypothetical protein